MNCSKYEHNLLYHFMPILYLHPDEETSPMSIEEYIDNCELCIGGKKKKIQKNLFCRPEIIRENKIVLLEKNDVKLPLQNKYDIMPNKYLNYCGKYDLPKAFSINLVPLYGIVKYYRNYTDIIYIFNYYYNNSYKLFNMYIGGEHQADLEHIRVRIKNNEYENNKYEVLRIYYSAHGTDQGRWEKPENIEWYKGIPNGQPIIYVAKGSHANYPKPGTWYRIFGLANDKTKKKGAIIWKPDTVTNLNDRDDLMSYQGDMGNNGVHDLNRDWDNAPSENIRASFLYRFFYPLSKSFKFSCCTSRK